MHAHGREAAGGRGYAPHRPEEAGLYYLVAQHYPAVVAHLAEQGKALPAYVEKEFEAYLKCGRLEHGFLRVRCESCHFERLVAFSCKRRGFCPSCGLRFTRVKALERRELEDVVQRIAERVGRALERMRLLPRDAETAWLDLPPSEDTDAMRQLIGSLVTYRIAVGLQAGRKALVLRTITPLSGDSRAS